MTARERIMAALEHRQPGRVPTFERCIDPGVGRSIKGSEAMTDIVAEIALDGMNSDADHARNRVDARDCVDEDPRDYLAMRRALRKYGTYPLEGAV